MESRARKSRALNSSLWGTRYTVGTLDNVGAVAYVEVPMSDRDQLYPLDQRAWMLAIGRRLRVEYDAIAEPVSPRLAALVKQLETPAQGIGQDTSRPAMAADHPVRPRSDWDEDWAA